MRQLPPIQKVKWKRRISAHRAFSGNPNGCRQALTRVRVGIAEEERSPTSTCGHVTAVGGAGDHQAGNVVGQDTIARIGEGFRPRDRRTKAVWHLRHYGKGLKKTEPE